MKKITTLLLAGATVFGLASCNNERENEAPQSGGTYLNISFYEPANSLKTVVDGQVEAEGTAEEKAVKNATFIAAGGTEVKFDSFAENSGVWKAADAKLYNGAIGSAVRTALVVNVPAGITTPLTTNPAIEIDKLADLASFTNGFTMSSKSDERQKIEGGVTKDQAKNGTKNSFTYEVERLASKAQVVEKQGGVEVAVPNFVGAKVADLKFAVAGSADKIYLYRDQAGERTLTADPAGSVFKYKGFKSAIHDNELTTFNADGTLQHARENLTKVSEKKLVGKGTGWDNDKQSLPIVAATNDDYQSKSNEAGIYFLENSLPVEVTKAGQVDYKDITHVKVYAKFIPADNQVTALNKGNLEPVPSAALEDPRTDGLPTGTFFRGVDDGKLYLTLEASKAAGNSKSERYTGGIMFWYVPANAQRVAGQNFDSYLDTRRNNIYSLKINKITGLGHNWDPNDPQDPNTPKPGEGGTPDNPDEPGKPAPTPVSPDETHIHVQVRVLNWNLVHRGVDL